MKKKNSNKKPFNKWKITAIISLVINGLVALLLLVGFLGTPPKVNQASALSVYNNQNIVVEPNSFNQDAEYFLYFNFDRYKTSEGEYRIAYQDYTLLNDGEHDFYFLDNVVYQNITYLYIYTRFENNHPQIVVEASNGNHAVLGDIYIYTINYPTSYIKWNSSFLNLSKELFSGKYRIDLSSSDGYFIAKNFTQYSIQNLYMTGKSIQNLNGFYELPYLNDIYEDLVDLTYDWLNNWIIRFDTDPNIDLVLKLASGQFEYQGYKYDGLFVRFEKCVEIPSFFGQTYINTQGSTINNVGYENAGVIEVDDDGSNGFFYIPSMLYLEGGNAPLVSSNTINLFKLSKVNYNRIGEAVIGASYVSCFERVSSSNFRLNVLDDNSPFVSWSALKRLFNVTNVFNFVNYDGVVSIEIIPIDTGSDVEIGGGATLGNIFVLIRQAFESLVPILAISIVPGLSVGLLIFIPVILGIIIIIFKMVKK